MLSAGIGAAFPGEPEEAYYYCDANYKKPRGVLYSVYLDLREECRKLGIISKKTSEQSNIVESLKGMCYYLIASIQHEIKIQLLNFFITDITADSELFSGLKDYKGEIDENFIAKWRNPVAFEARKAYYEITPTTEIFLNFPCFELEGGLVLVIIFTLSLKHYFEKSKDFQHFPGIK